MLLAGGMHFKLCRVGDYNNKGSGVKVYSAPTLNAVMRQAEMHPRG